MLPGLRVGFLLRVFHLGHVADLVTEGGEEVGLVHIAPCAGIDEGKLQRTLCIKMVWVGNLVPVFGKY